MMDEVRDGIDCRKEGKGIGLKLLSDKCKIIQHDLQGTSWLTFKMK